MHDARTPHLLHALSRIGRAAGLAPVALAPLLAACEVDDASLGPAEIPADAVGDDVEEADLVPASGQAVRASEGRVRTLPSLEPSTASASASTQAVRPFLRLEGLVAPGHVARFRAGGIPPEGTVHLMAGTHDEMTVGGSAVYIQQVHPLATVEAGIDGEEEIRVLISDELVEAFAGSAQPPTFWLEVQTADGERVDSRRLGAAWDEVTPDRAGFRELHPDFDPDRLQPGDRARACVPDEGLACDAVADFHEWQALEIASYALDATIPADLTASACIDETAFAGSCCYVVEFWAPQVTNAADVCVPPERNNNNNGGGGGGGGGWWYEGRPFHTDAGRHEAPVTSTSGWSALPALAASIPEDLRDAVVDAWTDMGRAEHASVASFARMVMELLSLGAPAELVAQATQAQLDEVRHAQLAFGVASAIARRPIGPGAFDIAGALDRSHDLAEVLRAAIVEGCISETVASVQVRDAADHAADPALAALLHGVADDELRHAELSWAFVRWILQQHPELHGVARDAFASFEGGSLPAAGPHDEALSAWGVRPVLESHLLGLRILEQVVRPAAEAMFADLPVAEA